MSQATAYRLKRGRTVRIGAGEESIVVPVSLLMHSAWQITNYQIREKLAMALEDEVRAAREGEPLAWSDQMIIDLDDEGSRRTVTKVRQEFGIPNSLQRLRAYRLDPQTQYQVPTRLSPAQ